MVVLCLLTLVFYKFQQRPTQNSSTLTAGLVGSLSVPEKPQPGLPVRLKIPRLSVDASVEHLGLTANGELDAPKVPTTVGWYEAGPRPGEVGSAVMDGHYGWVNNKAAVFDNLYTLQKGDKILVEDETGKTTTFVVYELRTYQPEDDATAVFRSKDGKAHLNLITCQGVWNKGQQSFSTRLVVFADMTGNE